MADTTRVSNEAVDAEAAAFADLLDLGFLRLYTGSQPASVDTAIGAQVQAAELRFATPSESGIVNGVITFDTITSDPSAVGGTVAWFRAFSADGTSAQWDGSVGTSGATLNLNSVVISAGTEVAVTGLTFTVNRG